MVLDAEVLASLTGLYEKHSFKRQQLLVVASLDNRLLYQPLQLYTPLGMLQTSSFISRFFLELLRAACLHLDMQWP